VWRFGRNDRKGRRKAPHNIFAETDFYTIRLPDGSKDLELERDLSTLESEFCRIRRDAITARATLPMEDKAWLCTFTAAMHGRTLSQRDHWKRQWEEIVEIGEQIKQGMEGRTTEEQMAGTSIRSADDGPSLSEEDVKKLADQPIQHMLPSQIRSQMRFLPAMNLTIFARATISDLSRQIVPVCGSIPRRSSGLFRSISRGSPREL
jgi:hypothetical protein